MIATPRNDEANARNSQQALNQFIKHRRLPVSKDTFSYVSGDQDVASELKQDNKD